MPGSKWSWGLGGGQHDFFDEDEGEADQTDASAQQHRLHELLPAELRAECERLASIGIGRKIVFQVQMSEEPCNVEMIMVVVRCGSEFGFTLSLQVTGEDSVPLLSLDVYEYVPSFLYLPFLYLPLLYFCFNPSSRFLHASLLSSHEWSIVSSVSNNDAPSIRWVGPKFYLSETNFSPEKLKLFTSWMSCRMSNQVSNESEKEERWV